jgi:hypothetical protein
MYTSATKFIGQKAMCRSLSSILKKLTVFSPPTIPLKSKEAAYAEKLLLLEKVLL